MRFVIRGPVVLMTVGAGALLMGAEPAGPRVLPPLPVPPVERQAKPPFLAKITISGDVKMSGVFEECLDPAGAGKSARARAEVRPANAPSPMTGCASSIKMQPGGAIHHELSCDQAKGAKADVRFVSDARVVSDGTISDMHLHMVRTGPDPATGTQKTTTYDARMINQGSCPADLKPGEMRRPGGPVLDAERTREILRLTRGQAE